MQRSTELAHRITRFTRDDSGNAARQAHGRNNILGVYARLSQDLWIHEQQVAGGANEGRQPASRATRAARARPRAALPRRRCGQEGMPAANPRWGKGEDLRVRKDVTPARTSVPTVEPRRVMSK